MFLQILKQQTQPLNQILMQDQTISEKFIVHSLLFDPESLMNINILIVGVGGIGCELLKVLSKSPIGKVHILDMDTIQISNLNRQFLFKVQHKGQSKSLVAKESINRLNPYLNITAHHNNIKEMPISFFKQFHFLVMALDNIDARNYVNKIGVRLNIPIIDAGTLAYKGNSRMIIPRLTSCYSCQPKSSSQKSFPVCTIRMRPEKPIHCVVWGKMLFEVFFSQDRSAQQMKQHAQGDMDDLGELTKKIPEEIFKQLFNTQIQAIKHAKTEQDSLLSEMYMKKIQPIPNQTIESSLNGEEQNLDSFDQFDDKISLERHINIAQQAYRNLLAQKRKENIILFEKDDDMIIHFISSMANIRMRCFSIDDGDLSFNQVKNMAGNIVPAIASTNSIVSGLQVLQMLKFIVYEGNLKYLKQYYVQNLSYKVRGMNVQKPNPDCLVCSQTALPCSILANFCKTTFDDVVNFIKTKLKDIEEYSINAGQKQLYNSEEPRQIILKKTLQEISNKGFEIQLILTNQDTSQKICSIWLVHDESLDVHQLNIFDESKLSNRAVKPKEDKMEEESIKQANNDQSSDLVEVEQGHQSDDLVEVVDGNGIQGQETQRYHGKQQMIDEKQEEEMKSVVKKKRKME